MAQSSDRGSDAAVDHADAPWRRREPFHREGFVYEEKVDGWREGRYRQAMALAEHLGMRPLVAHCHLGLGKLYLRAGGHEQAQEDLATATMMYREMGMMYWLEKAEAEMRESA